MASMLICACGAHSGHDRRFGPEPSNSGYGRGCRCISCKAARRSYLDNKKTSIVTAQKAGSVFGPANGESSEPNPEPANRDCPDCGLPMVWDIRHTMNVCGSEHLMIPVKVENLAAQYVAQRSRELREIASPDVSNTQEFIFRRRTLLRYCANASAEFDVSKLEKQTGKRFWQREHCERVRDWLSAFSERIANARTDPDMSSLETEFLEFYQSQPLNNIRSNIHQTLDPVRVRMQSEPGYGSEFVMEIAGIDGKLSGIKPQVSFSNAEPNPTVIRSGAYPPQKAIDSGDPKTRYWTQRK